MSYSILYGDILESLVIGFRKTTKKPFKAACFRSIICNSRFYWTSLAYINYKIAYALPTLMSTLYEELLTDQ